MNNNFYRRGNPYDAAQGWFEAKEMDTLDLLVEVGVDSKIAREVLNDPEGWGILESVANKHIRTTRDLAGFVVGCIASQMEDRFFDGGPKMLVVSGQQAVVAWIAEIHAKLGIRE
jgi:hypothetical protein